MPKDDACSTSSGSAKLMCSGWILDAERPRFAVWEAHGTGEDVTTAPAFRFQHTCLQVVVAHVVQSGDSKAQGSDQSIPKRGLGEWIEGIRWGFESSETLPQKLGAESEHWCQRMNIKAAKRLWQWVTNCVLGLIERLAFLINRCCCFLWPVAQNCFEISSHATCCPCQIPPNALICQIQFHFIHLYDITSTPQLRGGTQKAMVYPLKWQFSGIVGVPLFWDTPNLSKTMVVSEASWPEGFRPIPCGVFFRWRGCHRLPIGPKLDTDMVRFDMLTFPL